MEISPFGQIDSANLEEYYDAEIQVGESTIEIDLNFESESIDASLLEPVSNFIDNINDMVSKAFKALSDDFDLGEESKAAKPYLQCHVDEFSSEELKTIFGSTEVNKALFLGKLFLTRVSLYPEDDEYFAIFDIQLPEEYTNYLIAVTFDNKGAFSHIAMES